MQRIPPQKLSQSQPRGRRGNHNQRSLAKGLSHTPKSRHLLRESRSADCGSHRAGALFESATMTYAKSLYCRDRYRSLVVDCDSIDATSAARCRPAISSYALGQATAIAVTYATHMAFAGSKPLSSRTAFSIESGRTRQHHDGLMTHGVLWPARTRLLSSRRHGEINRRSCLERVASEDSTLGARRESGDATPSSVLIQTNIICIWAWLI